MAKVVWPPLRQQLVVSLVEGSQGVSSSIVNAKAGCD